MFSSTDGKTVHDYDGETSLNEMNTNNMAVINTTSFYGKDQTLLEGIHIKKSIRLHSNIEMETKSSENIKSTSKKSGKSVNQKKVMKTNLFPDIMLPFKKRSIAKKLLVKTELCVEKTNSNQKKLDKNQFNVKKKVWDDYIRQEKPQRIRTEQSENRKFFKSKIIHTRNPKKKDDIFNLKIVNWGNENMMSSKVEVKKHDFNSTDILNVDGLQQTKLEVNELVESSHIDECDNGHTIAEHHPAPLSKSTKRHIKNDVENKGTNTSLVKKDTKNQNLSIYVNE